MRGKNVIQLHTLRPEESSITFDYTVAFLAALKYVTSHSLSHVSTTDFTIAAIQSSHVLAQKLDVLISNPPSEATDNPFERIKLFNLSDNKVSNTELDISFKRPEEDQDFVPSGSSTTIKLPKETISQLNDLRKVWGYKNRSVLISNAAYIYSMLVFEYYEKKLTPYKNAHFESNIIWREQL